MLNSYKRIAKTLAGKWIDGDMEDQQSVLLQLEDSDPYELPFIVGYMALYLDNLSYDDQEAFLEDFYNYLNHLDIDDLE